LVDPVKDTKVTLLSSDKAFPKSAPPQHKVTTPGGTLFFYKTFKYMILMNTSTIILTVKIDIKEAEGAAFKMVMFPQIIEIAKFHPKTA
jgi:hypothetical protein